MKFSLAFDYFSAPIVISYECCFAAQTHKLLLLLIMLVLIFSLLKEKWKSLCCCCFVIPVIFLLSKPFKDGLKAYAFHIFSVHIQLFIFSMCSFVSSWKNCIQCDWNLFIAVGILPCPLSLPVFMIWPPFVLPAQFICNNCSVNSLSVLQWQ